jgi:predicted RNA binding protein YcfA (HicA-like mRNA interferase family)
MNARKVGDVIKLLERDGWRLKKQTGSHRQFVHETKEGKVTVAGKPSTTLPDGTRASIVRQAKLPRRGDLSGPDHGGTTGHPKGGHHFK